ncbi:MAG: DNA gyrase inhibitor YacG [Pseudomonadales bacterium]
MSSEPGKVGETGKVCVFCRRHPVVATWRPFCSERCKLQDLARWADGNYRVPGDPVQGPDAEDPESRS